MADSPQENIVQPKTSQAPSPVANAESAQPATQQPTPVSDDSSTPAPDENRVLPEPDKSESPGPDVDTLIPSDPYYIDPLFYEVAQYFDLENEDAKVAKYKLSEIVDYVIKNEGKNKVEDVLLALRKLEENVGPPAWGERRYIKVYRYVRLLNRQKAAEKAVKAYEKGVEYGD